MSGKNNVNPDHYKVAGRDRPNEVLVGEPRVPDAYGPPGKGRGARNFIPGALPVGEAPARPTPAPIERTARTPARRKKLVAPRSRKSTARRKKTAPTRRTSSASRTRATASRGKRRKAA